MHTKQSLDTVKILKIIACTSHISFTLFHTICLAQFLVWCVILYFTITMAEANSIRVLPKEGVQSILEGYSVNDSDRSLPQVPNETLGLSSIRQNVSSSFNHLRRGITNCIGRNTNQPQSQTPMEVDAEQLSPNSLHIQLTAYQSTVRNLHEQNDHNAEILGCLEAAVVKKDSAISRLRIKETQKDLRLQAQHRDFQAQLSAEQAAREQVTNTLKGLRQELEALKESQNGPNPMDISLTDNNNKLNRECQKVEEEKRILSETLTKTKLEYEQALANKNREISTKIEHIKRTMEDQMCKEREQAAKASEHQLQSIMSELRALKEKQDKDTTERKVGEKALLDNIKASLDPILKSDYKSGDQIGVGAWLKHLQEEVTNYLPPTVNKKCGAAVPTDDTFSDLTLGGYRDARHVHFASTPITPEVSNINLITPPHSPKEETIAESV